MLWQLLHCVLSVFMEFVPFCTHFLLFVRLVSVEHETSENLQSLTAKLLEQQVHASKLRKQLKNIEESLPGIQEAKKLAASSKKHKLKDNLGHSACPSIHRLSVMIIYFLDRTNAHFCNKLKRQQLN